MTRQSRGAEDAGGDAGARVRRELRVWYWVAEMRGWAGTWVGRGSPAGRPDEGASGLEVVGQRLVELEVGNGVGLGEVEGRSLIEEAIEEIGLGRSAGRREGRGCVGEIEVEEDGGDDGRIGKERDDPHLSTAGGRAVSISLESGERIMVRGDVLLMNNTGVAPLVSASFGRSLPVWRIFPQARYTDPLDEPPFRSLFGHAHRPLALKMVADGSVMASGGWRGRWNPELGAGEALPDAVSGNWAEAVRRAQPSHN